MTDPDIARRMGELTAAAAKALADLATFMATDFPAAAATMARGKALEAPLQKALAELEAFSAAHPDLPVPTIADGPEKRAALLLFTSPTRH